MKKFIRPFLLLLLMLVASIYLVKDHYSEISHVIQTMTLWQFACLFLLASLVYVLQAVVFWLILKKHGQTYSFKDALQNIYISGFVSGIFSTTIGKGAQFLLLKAKHISWETTCHLCLMDQALYYIADLIVSGLCLIGWHSFFQTQLSSAWTIALLGYAFTTVFFLAIVILFVPWINQWCLKLLDHLLVRWHHSKRLRKLLQTGQNFVLEIRDAYVHHTLSFGDMLEIVMLNMVKVIVRNSLIFVILLFISDQIQFKQYGILFATTCFFEMVLNAIPVIGDKGAAEIGFVYIFALFTSEITATSGMLIWRFFTFVLNVFIGGIVLLFSKQISLKDILAQEKE